MTDEEPVRVLVVDDQRLIRDGIASLLRLQPGIAVVGTAANGREAVERALALSADVVLMDVRMPEVDGIAALETLRSRAPHCRVVMLTTFDDEEYVVPALRAGAAGYLLKDLPARELAGAVRMAHAGVGQFDPAATARVVAALTTSTVDSSTGGLPLTARETDVLRLIARGATNREIATDLHLGEGTVKNHISRILTRLGLRDRTQAALYAREHGLS
jgi:DNA-binding NarL/FixJ family response regulator